MSFILILTFIGIANAHEFWLMPNKFKFNVGDSMNLDFRVGEGFEGEYWDMGRHKVEKLLLFNRTGKTDVISKVKSTKGSNLSYTFNIVGTHVIAMESNQAYIELTPEKFNEYLEEDGLGYIKEEREKRDEQDKPSRELYARYAKVIVQAGDKTDDTCKKPAGLKLEIVPLQNPYDLKSGDYFGCKLLYRGNPEPHALVKVWSHVGNRIFLQNIYTESDGSIRFPISSSGPWMVSMVKMNRSTSPNAEWESLWASLVFEIE